MTGISITEKVIKLVADDKIDQAFELVKTHGIDHKIISDTGRVYGDEGKEEIAARFFQLLIMLDKKDYTAWGNLGVALFRQGKYEDAISCYERLIDINPNFPQAWTEKGSALIKCGKFKDAVACFNKALSLDSKFSDAWNNKGVALEKLGKSDEALSCYDKAIKFDPSRSDAWYNKGVVLSERHDNKVAIECFGAATDIDPNYVDSWFNKGLALAQIGKPNDAIECFETVITLDPKNADAWYNKGIIQESQKNHRDALESLSKSNELNPYNFASFYNKGAILINIKKYAKSIPFFDKSIELNPNFSWAWDSKGKALAALGQIRDSLGLFKKAIEINPEFSEAWFNWGTTLAELGEFNRAIRRFNKAIRINPQYAEAFANKGICFLRKYKYKKARTEFRKARNIFLKIGRKRDENLAEKYRLIADNAVKLISELEIIDNRFLKSLDVLQLSELKYELSTLSENINTLHHEFEEKNLPVEVGELLISKAICIGTLADTLNYKEVDLENLESTKIVFEKWKLSNFILAVNSIVSFVRIINKYKNIDEIPDTKKRSLMSLLSSVQILNGELTEKIGEKIDVDTFPVSTSLSREFQKAPEFCPIILDEQRKESVRICLVQLDYTLSSVFPYRLLDTEKTTLKEKVFRALEIAVTENVDIVCFPELSFDEGWLKDIKGKYKEMIIICGSYYDNTHRNICSILINGKDYPYAKCNPSPFEEKNGDGLQPGNRFYIFHTICGKIAVFTCIDFDLVFQYLYNNSIADIIINPRYDPDKDHAFQDKSNMMIDEPTGSKNQSFILHINSNKVTISGNTTGGGTCVIGFEHKYTLEKLKHDGLRPNDHIKYKVYEAKEEMLLIADIKIGTLTRPRIKSGNWYQYDGNNWTIMSTKSIW